MIRMIPSLERLLSVHKPSPPPYRPCSITSPRSTTAPAAW
jgi:hypothetical protein